jgi:hypothetical protein
MLDILYIAGVGRSGSTILGDILGTADGLYHVGEVKDFGRISYTRNYKCGCGDSIRNCDFWQQVLSSHRIDKNKTLSILSTLSKKIPRTHLVPFLLNTKNKLEASLLKCIYQLYYEIVSISNSNLIVDSSKIPSYLYVLSKIDDINLRVIHLVRDPRAICYSWHRKKIHGFKPNSDSRIGLGWTIRNSVLDYWGHKNPNKYIKIYYEDFAQRPNRCVNKIFDNYDINSENPMNKDGTVFIKKMHTTGGNPSKHKRQEVKIRPDDEWKNNLRFLPKYKVSFLTLPLLIKYRYII